jgi:CRISPR locus-related DNA-binding protein
MRWLEEGDHLGLRAVGEAVAEARKRLRRTRAGRIGLLGKLALGAAAAYYVAASVASGSLLGAHLVHAAALSAAGVVVEAARQKSIVVDNETVILLDTSGLDDRDRRILEALREHGPMGVSELSRLLGISKSVVSRKLKKLADMGLVEKTSVKGRPVYAAKA